MLKTPASEDLKASRLERAIEDLLVDYPYLIASHLPPPKRQFHLKDIGIVDLYFEVGEAVWIAEIKANTCTVSCVRQVIRYVQYLRTKHSEVHGLLIGPAINAQAAKLLNQSTLDLRFLKLEEDVPTKIVVCMDCRKAYAARHHGCPICGTRQVLL